MLYDNANDYWDARRKRKEYENSPEYKLAEAEANYKAQKRLDHFNELMAIGPGEVRRQTESGELEAWAKANGLWPEKG